MSVIQILHYYCRPPKADLLNNLTYQNGISSHVVTSYKDVNEITKEMMNKSHVDCIVIDEDIILDDENAAAKLKALKKLCDDTEILILSLDTLRTDDTIEKILDIVDFVISKEMSADFEMIFNKYIDGDADQEFVRLYLSGDIRNKKDYIEPEKTETFHSGLFAHREIPDIEEQKERGLETDKSSDEINEHNLDFITDELYEDDLDFTTDDYRENRPDFDKEYTKDQMYEESVFPEGILSEEEFNSEKTVHQEEKKSIFSIFRKNQDFQDVQDDPEYDEPQKGGGNIQGFVLGMFSKSKRQDNTEDDTKRKITLRRADAVPDDVDFNKIIDSEKESGIPLGTHKPFTIGVCGLTHGIGATHHALALAYAAAGRRNFKICYQENNIHNAYSSFKMSSLVKDKGGYLEMEGIDIYPYGAEFEAIYDVVVRDYGTADECSLSEFNDNDIPVVVTGAKDWEIEKLIGAYTTNVLKDKKLLVNFLPQKEWESLKNGFNDLDVYFADYAPEIFSPENNIRVYRHMLRDFIKI